MILYTSRSYSGKLLTDVRDHLFPVVQVRIKDISAGFWIYRY